MAATIVPIGLIEHKIYFIRGHKVMLDSDLAALYQVTTGNLNLAVRRNRQRFPRTSCSSLLKKKPILCYCKLQEQR